MVEHWTLLDDERELIAGKRGPTRLGFALLLKFYTQVGRFPRGRGELPDEAVEFVARQVDVEPPELGLYEWTGRTIEYHRAQIRGHLGFRECTVADAEHLTHWLAGTATTAMGTADGQETAQDVNSLPNLPRPYPPAKYRQYAHVAKSLEGPLPGNWHGGLGPGVAGKGPDQAPRQRPTGTALLELASPPRCRNGGSSAIGEQLAVEGLPPG